MKRNSIGLRATSRVAVSVVLIMSVLAGARAGATTTTSTTVPSCAGMATSNGLTHDQLSKRYGLDPLRASGFDGAGATVVLIEGETSVDTALVDQFLACQNLPGIDVRTQWVTPTANTPVGNEATIDVETIAELLPGLGTIHVLQQPDLHGFAEKFQATLTYLLGEIHAGRLHPDVISMSIGTCESDYGEVEAHATETMLKELTDAGVWFMKSAGDAGSSDCAGHGTCVSLPNPVTARAVEYPTTSRWLTAVGGTQFSGDPATATADVWKEPSVCSGGGGGMSRYIERPPWQDPSVVGTDGSNRMIPDITGLSGTPWYRTLVPSGHGGVPGWEGDGGTSLSTPMYASGMVLVRQALRASGIAVPHDLTAELYRIATDRAARSRVFVDVTAGDNDVYGVGCCSAETGYDLASGWGELRVDALFEELSTPSRPSFTG